MNAEASPYTFQSALDKFMNNFHHECTIPLNHESIISYEQDYHAYHQKYPELIRTITEIEESELMLPIKNNETPPDPSHTDQTSTEKGTSGKIQPRPAQIVALEALEQTIEYQYDKAMVVMATGLGKTYLAGFSLLNFLLLIFINFTLLQDIIIFCRKLNRDYFPAFNGGYIYGTVRTSRHL